MSKTKSKKPAKKAPAPLLVWYERPVNQIDPSLRMFSPIVRSWWRSVPHTEKEAKQRGVDYWFERRAYVSGEHTLTEHFKVWLDGVRTKATVNIRNGAAEVYAEKVYDPIAATDDKIRKLLAPLPDKSAADVAREQEEAQRLKDAVKALESAPAKPAFKSSQPQTTAPKAPKSAPDNKERHATVKAKQSEGVDVFGVKLGTRTARINAVLLRNKPLTIAEIEEKADAKAASSHLSKYVRLGILTKNDAKQYQLSPKAQKEYACPKQEKPSATSGGAKRASQSSPSKGKNSKSANKARPKTPSRSSASSRKAKPVNSAKRRTRRV